MIAHVSQYTGKKPTKPERDLRFCVQTQACGRVEMRYFAHPQDAEGTTLRLTPGEREQLALALAQTGTHFLLRDDGAEPTAKVKGRTKGARA